MACAAPVAVVAGAFVPMGVLVAPGVVLAFEAAAGGLLPFGFGGEAEAGPHGKCGGVHPVDADHGIGGTAGQVVDAPAVALAGGFAHGDVAGVLDEVRELR